MPDGLRVHYEAELIQFQRSLDANELQTAWHRLERAHVLGQAWAVEHSEVHWMMFIFGLRIKNWREVVGQLPRLIFGGVKSFVGKIPVGNTGGANVPPLRPMEIPDDMKCLLGPYLKNAR